MKLLEIDIEEEIDSNALGTNVVYSIKFPPTVAGVHGSGHYLVDEHSLDRFPETKIAAMSWGKAIHK